jgi:CubicO group peptidase (beta-lactamase class C family)
VHEEHGGGCVLRNPREKSNRVRHCERVSALRAYAFDETAQLAGGPLLERSFGLILAPAGAVQAEPRSLLDASQDGRLEQGVAQGISGGTLRQVGEARLKGMCGCAFLAAFACAGAIASSTGSSTGFGAVEPGGALQPIEAPAVAPARKASAPSPELEARVEAALSSQLQEGKYAGVSVALDYRGRAWESARGYADLENPTPVAPETVFEVGSITKQFTAVAVLQLVAQGKLDLDAPISRYLPELRKSWQPVLVRQLLNHTSGIPSYTGNEERWKMLRPFAVEPERLLEIVQLAPLDFEPGTRFAYSNTGYVLSGLLIEAVSGQPYASYLRRFVLKRAELEETFTCPARRLVRNRAQGYQLVDNVLQHAEYLDPSNAFAAGDLCSTARGLVRWQRALWAGRVLDAVSLQRLHQVEPLGDGTTSNYAFGLRVGELQGHRVFFHAGGISGFTGQLSYYPDDDLIIALLANIEDGPVGDLEQAVAAAVLGLKVSAVPSAR